MSAFSRILSMTPREMIRAWRNATLLLPSQEIIYRELFLRDLKVLGIEDQFYPVRAAANHGLLYVLTRAFRDFQIGSVLEFGAGQSTILFDLLKKQVSPQTQIYTIEHEGPWAALIGDRVDHTVVTAPLNGTGTSYGSGFYDASLIPAGKFNLLLVDGPQSFAGRNRLARNGFADIIASRLADDFIIIVDDAERSGEQKLVRRIRKLLRASNIEFREGEAIALGRQKLFCGGALRAAAYF
jgi:hypothetical protein